MQISGKHWFFDILFRHPGDNIVNLKNVLAEETHRACILTYRSRVVYLALVHYKLEAVLIHFNLHDI